MSEGVRVRDVDSVHLFLVGRDYHLGDLLWLTAVLAAYRRQIQPDCLLLGLPDRPISRILDGNPDLDGLLRGEPRLLRAEAERRFGHRLVLRDLRPPALAREMVRAWRYHLPWLYYRDLWFQARGQWLATFLHLGRLNEVRPIIALTEDDRALSNSLPSPYVAFAPHVGHYSLPLTSRFWRRLKGWGHASWIELARGFRAQGYDVVTLAGMGQPEVPGTVPVVGQPIRQVAGVIAGAAALITVESGLWYIAAAFRTPFVIVPWWLPRSINWPAPMNVPHSLVYRDHAAVHDVLSSARSLLASASE